MSVWRWVGVCVLAMMAAERVAAQASSVAVLSLPASARATGGGDVSPFVTDAGAVFYGAARLPLERSVMLSAGTWIGDVQTATLAVSAPMRWRGVGESVLALGVQSLDYGSADEYVPDPLTGGTRGTATGGKVGGNEMALTVGLAQGRGRYRTGVSATYVHQSLAGLGASALVMSASSVAALGDWNVSLGVEHRGASARDPSRRTLDIPTTARFSVETPRVLFVSGDWHAVGEYRRSGVLGATSAGAVEGEFHPVSGWTLSVRSAVLSYSEETVRAPWSVGGSAARGAWRLDYAYQGYGVLGAVHRMGISWRSDGARNPSR